MRRFLLLVTMCACSSSPAHDKSTLAANDKDGSGDALLLDAWPQPDVAKSPDSLGIDATPSQDAGAQPWAPLVTARPYVVKQPANYDAAKAWPLVLMLHGYAESALFIDGWFHFGSTVDDLGFLLAMPEGTADATGMRFWNASETCCDLYGSGVNDVAYLQAVIDDMAFKFNVDPARIYVVGHSNGAFMAHRLACESADRIAAIVAVSGAAFKDIGKCKASQPVAILQVHGTLDAVISYLGGSLLGGGVYPSATDSIGGWAQLNGCNAKPESAESLDLDGLLLGKETAVLRWSGCKPQGAAELWSVQGASHFPVFTASWPKLAIGWLQQHARN